MKTTSLADTTMIPRQGWLFTQVERMIASTRGTWTSTNVPHEIILEFPDAPTSPRFWMWMFASNRYSLEQWVIPFDALDARRDFWEQIPGIVLLSSSVSPRWTEFYAIPVDTALGYQHFAVINGGVVIPKPGLGYYTDTSPQAVSLLSCLQQLHVKLPEHCYQQYSPASRAAREEFYPPYPHEWPPRWNERIPSPAPRSRKK